MTSLEIIDEARNILSSESEIAESFSYALKKLEDDKRNIKANILRLGVIGVTSSGKSTLINALLGEELLPAEAKPSSSQLVSCRKGEDKKAIVYFNNGSYRTFVGKEVKYILSKYGNEQLNRGNREGVQQIVLQTSAFSLNPSVVLIDSPGLDAHGFPGHESLTMETLLPSIDFCMFVTTCKTNSDRKMQEVLNAVARYNKPLVIVQNMVDAVESSADGKKSKTVVAAETLHRVRKVVNASNIKDKSQVHIIQISAKYALECRTALKKENRRLNKWGEEKWRISNFDNLVSTLNNIVEVIQPNIDFNRILNLRSYLQSIIKELEPKIKNLPPSISSKAQSLKNDFDNEIKKIGDRIRNVFTRIDTYISISKNESVFNENKIREVVTSNKTWSNELVKIIYDYNNFLKEFCPKLYISERDLVFTFTPSKINEPRVAKKTITETKRSFWKTIFTLGFGGKYTVTTTIDDPVETKRLVIQFLEASKSDLQFQIGKWNTNLNKGKKIILAKIEEEKKREEEAEKRRLNLQKLFFVFDSLNSLIKKINLISAPRTAIKDNNGGETELKYYEEEINKETYLIYKLAKTLRKSIHKQVFEAFSNNNKGVVYTWDSESAKHFIAQTGVEVFNLIHNPTHLQEAKNHSHTFILVNLTQPGATQKQLSGLNLQELQNTHGKLIFVIQDFKETVTGGHYVQALEDMDNFLKGELKGKRYLWYPVFSNPIVPLTFLLCQNTTISNHMMELELANEIVSKFRFLVDEGDENLSHPSLKQMIANIIHFFTQNKNI